MAHDDLLGVFLANARPEIGKPIPDGLNLDLIRPDGKYLDRCKGALHHMRAVYQALRWTPHRKAARNVQFFNISAIAVALAMDAFAVAVAAGVTLRSVSFRQYFRLGWHFGLFQALMPIIGWAAGLTVRQAIEAYAHWIAVALLLFVAGGMLREAFRGGDPDCTFKDPTRGLTMVMLSVATSIDALAVGLSLSMIQVTIWTPALIIGLVAGLFTLAGMYLGKTIGCVPRLRRYAEILGALVLVAIGVNILFQHGVFSRFS
jgi:manganese efflux pump family protein